ncbi:hypothetical protein TNCV_2273491 [Trichonephila clavipes]|nr:hypothetical protein TNCV_2273491 [Trichonephila clavipes]
MRKRIFILACLHPPRSPTRGGSVPVIWQNQARRLPEVHPEYNATASGRGSNGKPDTPSAALTLQQCLFETPKSGTTSRLTGAGSLPASRLQRSVGQRHPNCNTNPKATVFGIPKEPILESAELITSRLTGAGSLLPPVYGEAWAKGHATEPQTPLSPVRVAAHGKHAGQTQNQS